MGESDSDCRVERRSPTPLNLRTAEVHARWTNEAEVHVVWVTLQDFGSQNLRQKAVHVAQTFSLEVKVCER